MIGVNDFGMLPNPGSTGRSTAVHDSEEYSRVVGIADPKVTNKFIAMMEDIWEEIRHHHGY